MDDNDPRKYDGIGWLYSRSRSNEMGITTSDFEIETNEGLRLTLVKELIRAGVGWDKIVQIAKKVEAYIRGEEELEEEGEEEDQS